MPDTGLPECSFKIFVVLPKCDQRGLADAAAIAAIRISACRSWLLFADSTSDYITYVIGVFPSHSPAPLIAYFQGDSHTYKKWNVPHGIVIYIHTKNHTKCNCTVSGWR